MANIGATTAFYKVETSLTRANSEVSKSMERLATGKQNANAGDRSSYVAMADTFRLDFVGTKAGIKGASVTMGYLETGMRVLDSASALLSRLQELAVLGANDTNTTADHEAINLEAEAIGDEFNRLMTTSTYKGRDVFNTTAGSLYVSMGGRDQEMTFGIGEINYGALYGTGANERTIAATSTVDGPNKACLRVSRKICRHILKTIRWKHLNALTEGMTFRMTTDTLTKDIEAIQGLVNTARVQAGSQYAAIESAVNYTTDLTAQYELGYNTVNDVNFSMETAHLAKNQILQQAATAMLAQANQGQQGLLQLIS
jgi:flagellin